MTKEYLILQLENIEHARRINRLRVANLVLQNQELFPFLLELVFEIDNKTSIKAAWVLEFVCDEKLEWLAPYLTFFTNTIDKVKFDSAVRPVSKICELLAKAYTSKTPSIIQSEINS